MIKLITFIFILNSLKNILFQKFKFIVKSLETDDQIVSIINMEPKFMIEEPKQENYKFVILAFNEKGESENVEIEKDSIIDESEGIYYICCVSSSIFKTRFSLLT